MGWNLQTRRAPAEYFALTDAEKQLLTWIDVRDFIATDTLQLAMMSGFQSAGRSPQECLDRMLRLNHPTVSPGAKNDAESSGDKDAEPNYDGPDRWYEDIENPDAGDQADRDIFNLWAGDQADADQGFPALDAFPSTLFDDMQTLQTQTVKPAKPGRGDRQ